MCPRRNWRRRACGEMCPGWLQQVGRTKIDERAPKAREEGDEGGKAGWGGSGLGREGGRRRASPTCLSPTSAGNRANLVASGRNMVVIGKNSASKFATISPEISPRNFELVLACHRMLGGCRGGGTSTEPSVCPRGLSRKGHRCGAMFVDTTGRNARGRLVKHRQNRARGKPL